MPTTTKKMSIAGELSGHLAGMEKTCWGAGIGKFWNVDSQPCYPYFAWDIVLDPKGKLNKWKRQRWTYRDLQSCWWDRATGSRGVALEASERGLAITWCVKGGTLESHVSPASLIHSGGRGLGWERSNPARATFQKSVFVAIANELAKELFPPTQNYFEPL